MFDGGSGQQFNNKTNDGLELGINHVIRLTLSY
jgi:hypothetical protein